DVDPEAGEAAREIGDPAFVEDGNQGTAGLGHRDASLGTAEPSSAREPAHCKFEAGAPPRGSARMKRSSDLKHSAVGCGSHLAPSCTLKLRALDQIRGFNRGDPLSLRRIRS